MKTKSFIAGAFLAAGLLFWIGWTVANGNFNTNQFNATYPYVNIKNGVLTTNLTDGGTVTAQTVIASGGTSNYLGGQTVITNLYMALARYTVATLPANPITGQEAWATDAITSSGTGGRIIYDGTNWRLGKEGIIVTADIPTFIRNAYNALYNGSSPMSSITSLSQNENPSAFPGRYTNSTGTAAVVSLQSAAALGSFISYATGSTATGVAISFCRFTAAMAANSYIGCGGRYFVGNNPDGTDNYWALVGMASSSAAAFPTSGAFFLYDKYTNAIPNGTVPLGATANWTNNWLCVTGQGGYTITDSGMPATGTTTAVSEGLWVTYTNGAVLFYTNGVLAITHTANLPTTTLWGFKVEMQKTLGGTSRLLDEAVPGAHIRLAAYTPFP